MTIPRLYPILDAGVFPTDPDARATFLTQLGRELADSGLTLLEYRNKSATDAEVFADARLLRAVLPVGRVRLVMGDRVDIALAADFDGVHVDDGDLPPSAARLLLESALGSRAIVGTSASTEAALAAALRQPVDYIAFGPIFPTTTKQTSSTPVGLDGVRCFRALAGPDAILVAAGRHHARNCADYPGCRSQFRRCLRRHLPRNSSGSRTPPLAGRARLIWSSRASISSERIVARRAN